MCPHMAVEKDQDVVNCSFLSHSISYWYFLWCCHSRISLLPAVWTCVLECDVFLNVQAALIHILPLSSSTVAGSLSRRSGEIRLPCPNPPSTLLTWHRCTFLLLILILTPANPFPYSPAALGFILFRSLLGKLLFISKILLTYVYVLQRQCVSIQQVFNWLWLWARCCQCCDWSRADYFMLKI